MRDLQTALINADGFSASYSNSEAVLEVVSGLRLLGPKVSLGGRATRETVNLLDE